MKWVKFTLQTTIYAVELISNMLMEMGIQSIEIIDNIPLTDEEKRAMFIDILPQTDSNDKRAKISFYLDTDIDVEETTKSIKTGLEKISEFVNIGTGSIEISETEDLDWINNWKGHFKPFRLADNIIIKPTWESLNDFCKTDIIIEIDPGTAFGTGSHETTQLCINALKKYISPDEQVLDIGCGSGILSIIATKLGAKRVLGIDIDPNAVKVSYENAEVNNIQSKDIDFLHGNLLDEHNEMLKNKIGLEHYGIVVANILADVIIPLSASIGKYLKSGGYFISSGIINKKLEEVKEAILNNGFEIIETNTMGDWVSFIGRKI